MVKKEIVQTEETFVNPYIFLPLETKCDKKNNIRELKEDIDLLTGWIDCQLTTKSAVFIPNTTYDKIFLFPEFEVSDELDFDKRDFKSYDFYSYKILDKNDMNLDPPEPIFPASELRAIIRVSFEALTNSCVSTIDDKIVLHKRLPTAGGPAKICKENNSWVMKKCKKVRIKKDRITRIFNNNDYIFQIDDENYREGNQVYVSVNVDDKVIEISHQETNKCKIEGYIHFSEDFKNKVHESVFIVNENKGVFLSKETVNNYIKNIKIYHNNNAYSWIKSNNDTYLVYYKEKDGLFYFKPGAIGRDVFFNSFIDILQKNNSNYDPCQTIDFLCPSCLLFGFTSNYKDKSKNALGSRVRFTDGKRIKDQNLKDIFFEKGISKELSNPKVQTTEFYLKRPQYSDKNKKVDLWTYDYAGNWSGQTLIWEGNNKYTPEICGRKFYWHKKITNQNDLPYIENGTEANRKVGIRPLKADIKFIFKIFFNNIKEKELQQLLWVLEQGNKDNTQSHKIGMGKPLGLGSVKITVNDIIIRKIKFDGDILTYEVKKKENSFMEKVRNHGAPEKLLGCLKETLEKYLLITDLDHKNDNIEYPNNLDSEENYDWFMDNLEISPGSAFKWIVKQHLCNNIKKPILYKYEKKEKSKSQSQKVNFRSKRSDFGAKKLGTVKWFNFKKGYGFIDIDDEQEDIFVHYNNIVGTDKSLNIGDEVEFEIGKGKKGPQAENVRKI